MSGNQEADGPTTEREIWKVRSPESWILVVRGDFDSYSSEEIRAELNEAVATKVPTVLVDLEETTFMDPVGLGVLVDALHAAQLVGVDLRLVAPSEPVLRLLQLTSLEQLFEVESDLVQAYPHVA